MPQRTALACAILAALTLPAFAHDRDESETLAPITVSAAREDSPLAKLANNITVTREAEMQKNLNSSVEEALENTPGVSFDGSGRYGLSDITIRGVSGNRVKVLVDGQEINSQFSFGPFQNAGRQYMDLHNVKQLEVIKGPVSSLHGSDAIGGVVSLVSKTPDDYLQDGQRIGGTAFSQYSGKNHGITAGGAIAVAPSEQWDGLISYTYNHEHETQNHGGRAIAGAARTTPDPQRDHSHSVEGKLRYKPNADHTITFAASAYQEHRDTNVLSSLGNSMNLYRYDDYQGKDKQQRTAASLRHDFTLNQPVADSGYWRLYWQKQDSSQKTLMDGLMLRGGETAMQRYRKSDYQMRDLGGEIQLNKVIDGSVRQNWIYGVNYSHKNVDMRRHTRDTYGGRPSSAYEKNAPDSSIDQLGLFAQNRISFGASGFSLIPGVRYDHYRLNAKPDQTFWNTVGSGYQVRDYREGQLSWRLGALYDIGDSHTLYANYAEGFRAPAFNETNLGFENASQGYSYIANPGLKPEKSRGIEIGWRSDNGILKHDLSAYYTRYRNFIQSQTNIGRDPQSGLIAFSSVNLPSAEIYGVELASELDIGALNPTLNGLTGDLALAWADGKNRSKHTPITNLSPFSGHIGLNYDKDGRWGMGTRWRFAMKKADKDIDNEGVRSPLKGSGGYGIWDITGYYRPTKGLTARAGAFNILDKKYITWGEAKGLADDISRECYSAPGRWFGASLRYDF